MRRSTRVVLAGLATIAVEVLSRILLEASQSSDIRIILALAPLPFMAWFIYEEVHLIRSMDEFHRKVLLDALAISFPLAVFIGISVEAIQKAGFLQAADIGDVWPWMALSFLPSLIFVFRQYHSEE